ncbi:hypothetical protein BJ875DRAFT_360579, partial [Amylocarpus encephaloides]
MDIDTEDDVLKNLADGKPMNYEQWPALLSRLIPRLDKIVQTEFPPRPFLASQPSSSHPIPSSPPTQTINAQASSQNSLSSSLSTNKENAAPVPKDPLKNLAPSIQVLLTSIKSTLQSLFTKHPPYTIQRLAELLLFPKQHYKTLSSYLHAVDRVVHVTSGAHVFPLPPAVPGPSSVEVLSNGTIDPLSITWSNPTSTAQLGLGSDESLGGALLTPIPWLTNSSKNGGGSQHSGGSHSPLEREVKTESTEMIEGPNGPGGIETVTVSVNGGISLLQTPGATAAAFATNDVDPVAVALRAEGGVTQGELLRQEQRAGVIPAAQLKGEADGLGDMDEVPHARGPEEIGMEDTGPQSNTTSTLTKIDADAAVGRKEEIKETEDEE